MARPRGASLLGGPSAVAGERRSWPRHTPCRRSPRPRADSAIGSERGGSTRVLLEIFDERSKRPLDDLDGVAIRNGVTDDDDRGRTRGPEAGEASSVELAPRLVHAESPHRAARRPLVLFIGERRVVHEFSVHPRFSSPAYAPSRAIPTRITSRILHLRSTQSIRRLSSPETIAPCTLPPAEPLIRVSTR